MISNHGCECAACNMRRAREAKAFDDGFKELCEKIKRGEFDHLKPKNKEIEVGN